MKAATLRAAYAWAVAHAGRDVENRGCRCPSILGQRIAIHAGAYPLTPAASKRQEDDLQWIWQHAGVMPGVGQMGLDYGCVVATALITGWSFADGRGRESVSRMPWPGFSGRKRNQRAGRRR